MSRQHVSSGGAWEAQVGYARAVRVGPTVHLSGTTAPGADARAQTEAIFEIAEKALAALGARLEDVVRTRMYVIDIEKDWPAIAEVHQARLGKTPPAATMVQVAKFIAPEVKVEIEMEAIIPGQSSL
ncbi:RutC family protein C23G10.2 [Hondaea fermentalgiana]|uniref:RutC family protein C23G10.2 n=1 Tax=Hondaea fermentalgiana TaxID=2315210 RepID=A0A2R5G8A0_9STRA|nr:RutC family protein C23G10.2 [Hondaea fermentalgiana]|eukprot:GBG27220.1 RutC family protein C23G10.2 [Hondaea fermentalgiana]